MYIATPAVFGRGLRMPQFVLTHSPLVGRSSVIPAADALGTLGIAIHIR